MIKNIQKLIKKIIGINHIEAMLLKQHFEFNNKLNELEWALVYRDSIRGKAYLENNSLNVGRWAGNYSFFYVLNRILHEVKPKRIFEVGLGESSKFISRCADNIDQILEHLVIEHDVNWIEIQSKNFQEFKKTKICHHDLEKIKFENFEVLNYKNLNTYFEMDFDLFVIDGPFGTDNFSRSQIVEFVKRFDHDKTFIILLDDTHRFGERQTLELIAGTLSEKQISFFQQDYSGNKSVSIITSRNLQFVTSL